MTILVKNVDIADGESEDLFHGDVFVSGDKISAIGNFPNKKADEIIDGQGMVLLPGFIDVHSHVDHFHSLIGGDYGKNFLSQGITTLICGQDGISLAPVGSRNVGLVSSLGFGRNIGWHDFQDLVKLLERIGTEVNVGSFVGSSTLTEYLGGKNIFSTTHGKRKFGYLLDKMLSQGCLGLSISRGIRGMGSLSEKTLKNLMLLSHKVGVLSFAGNGREIEEFLTKFYSPGKGRIIFTNVKPEEDELLRIFGLVTEKSKGKIYFQLNTLEENVYPIGSFLPKWFAERGLESMRESFKDEWMLKRVAQEIDLRPPEKFHVVFAGKHNPRYAGKSLKELMAHFGFKKFPEIILYLAAATDFKATISSNNFNGQKIKNAILSDYSLIGSSSMGLGRDSEIQLDRETSAFSAFLSFATQNSFSLAKVAKKIAGTPAKVLSLEKRGLIREGYYSDLVCLKENEVRYVILNGKVVVRNGEYEEKRSGKILLKKE